MSYSPNETYNMYVVKKFEIVFSFNFKNNKYIFPCLHNIRLSYNIRNDFMLYQSECACLHQTVNMVVFFVKSNENTTQKGEHSCKCTKLSLNRKEGDLIGKLV